MRIVVGLILLSVGVTCSNLSKKFRSERINYIYDKAIQHIEDRKRLQKLEGDLGAYDNLYMSAKEDLHDKKGDFQKEISRIDKKLYGMLETYDLQNAIKAFNEKMKFKNDFDTTKDSFDASLVKFEDERLDKLWHAAMSNKFSEEELKDLHEELKHAEALMGHHDDALRALNKVPSENSVHSEDDVVAQIDEHHKTAKSAHKRLTDHLDKLHEKVHETPSTTFETEKVKQMWKLAQTNKNFTTRDLDILKEELIHLDKQLKKIEYHQGELASRKEKLEKSEGGMSGSQHFDDVELEAKNERMDRKIRKLEKYLRSKITHSEL